MNIDNKVSLLQINNKSSLYLDLQSCIFPKCLTPFANLGLQYDIRDIRLCFISLLDNLQLHKEKHLHLPTFYKDHGFIIPQKKNSYCEMKCIILWSQRSVITAFLLYEDLAMGRIIITDCCLTSRISGIFPYFFIRTNYPPLIYSERSDGLE